MPTLSVLWAGMNAYYHVRVTEIKTLLKRTADIHYALEHDPVRKHHLPTISNNQLPSLTITKHH